jgi:hypothetical protein
MSSSIIVVKSIGFLGTWKALSSGSPRGRGRARGWSGLIAALALGLSVSPAGAGHAAGGAPAPVAQTPYRIGHTSEDPYENLLELLRLVRLLLLAEGDVVSPAITDSQSEMSAIMSIYSSNGAPENLSEQERAEARTLVENTYHATLAVAPPLDPQVTNPFLQTLSALYADLGGNPMVLGG